MSSVLETKIAINRVALIVIGVIVAVAFTWGAFAIKQWWWLVAPPMDLIGIAFVLKGQRRRRETEGRRGMAVSVLGAVLIVGSIWAAFILGNRFNP